MNDTNVENITVETKILSDHQDDVQLCTVINIDGDIISESCQHIEGRTLLHFAMKACGIGYEQIEEAVNNTPGKDRNVLYPEDVCQALAALLEID